MGSASAAAQSALAREFRPDQISSNFRRSTPMMPESESYRRDIPVGFRNWRLMSMDLLPALPSSRWRTSPLPSRTQITQHVCEQGWSAIAEWTGVPLSVVLNSVGIQPSAKYVFFTCVDDWWDSIDMADAFILKPLWLME
jgi:hypothetical protein